MRRTFAPRKDDSTCAFCHLESDNGPKRHDNVAALDRRQLVREIFDYHRVRTHIVRFDHVQRREVVEPKEDLDANRECEAVRFEQPTGALSIGTPGTLASTMSRTATSSTDCAPMAFRTGTKWQWVQCSSLVTTISRPRISPSPHTQCSQVSALRWSVDESVFSAGATTKAGPSQLRRQFALRTNRVADHAPPRDQATICPAHR